MSFREARRRLARAKQRAKQRIDSSDFGANAGNEKQKAEEHLSPVTHSKNQDHHSPSGAQHRNGAGQGEDEKRFERRVAGATQAIAWLTGVLTIIAAVSAFVSYKTLFAIQGQLDAMHSDTVLARPPQLDITNVTIDTACSGDKNWIKRKTLILTAGANIKGSAWVVNRGQTYATIETPVCVSYWAEDGLPMVRPYDNDFSNRVICGDLKLKAAIPIKKGAKLQSGDIANWCFDINVPPDFEKKTLYIMGHIIYWDEIHTRHAVLFARKYSKRERRFEPVKDSPDYENHE